MDLAASGGDLVRLAARMARSTKSRKELQEAHEDVEEDTGQTDAFFVG